MKSSSVRKTLGSLGGFVHNVGSMGLFRQRKRPEQKELSEPISQNILFGDLYFKKSPSDSQDSCCLFSLARGFFPYSLGKVCPTSGGSVATGYRTVHPVAVMQKRAVRRGHILVCPVAGERRQSVISPSPWRAGRYGGANSCALPCSRTVQATDPGHSFVSMPG